MRAQHGGDRERRWDVLRVPPSRRHMIVKLDK
jgi:hypothetical protein